MKVWKQKNGIEILVKEMTALHIQNCIRMLEKKVERLDDKIAACYQVDPESMASYYADHSADRASTLQQKHITRIEYFKKELQHRKDKI